MCNDFSIKKSRIQFSHIKYGKTIIMYAKRLLFLSTSVIQADPMTFSVVMHWKIQLKKYYCTTGWHNDFSMLPR